MDKLFVIVVFPQHILDYRIEIDAVDDFTAVISGAHI